MTNESFNVPNIFNIDDEYSLKGDSGLTIGEGFVDLYGFESLVKTIKENPQYLQHLINPSTQTLIVLDEHLPYDSYDGKDIYPALGRFIIKHSNRPDLIYLLGNSSDWAQSYIPLSNRVKKEFYARATLPERLFSYYKPLSVREVFDQDGFNSGGAKHTSYLECDMRAFDILEKLLTDLSIGQEKN